MDLYSAYSLRTTNALDTNKYVLIRCLKQSVLLIVSLIKYGSEFQAIGKATKNAQRL